MTDALVDLLFWIVVFLVFFYGFRWIQSRKKKKNSDENE